MRTAQQSCSPNTNLKFNGPINVAPEADRGNLRNPGHHPNLLRLGVRIMMNKLLQILWRKQGQALAEYGVILAVILVLVMGTVRLVGHNTANAFSSVASSVN
jgi:Flp pilus assembly pilin Flp